MSAARRTIVLGDLHLSRATSRAVSSDLAAVLRAHPGARVVFAGDLFDLSAETPARPPREAVGDVLAHHAAVGPALAEHVDRGGELLLVGGNHDAHVAAEDFTSALAAALDLTPTGRRNVHTSPWFFRLGGAHIEHGHLYDPDNAPAHPLVAGAPSLGVHFVESFIAPTGAHHYLNANDQVPLELFLSSFTHYGRRAPHVIYRYFHTAIAAMLQSGPFYRAHDERKRGALETRRFADDVGLPSEVVEALLAEGARPTLESFAATFTRIYFDRVLCTIAMGLGLGGVAAGARAAGAMLFALGGVGMAYSWSRGKDRYGGRVTDRLADGASRIAERSGAKLVIFGHTHREALEDTYANTASFAFPQKGPGRPFLELEGSLDAPRAVRRYWSAA